MASTPNNEVIRMAREPYNKHCFDCGTTTPMWASVNNSVYLCLECAGVHRGMGVNISFIRSIQMDKWSEEQVRFMKAGGNERLRNLIKEYGVPLDTPADKMYRLNLLDYYRKLLRHEVLGEPEPTKPDPIGALGLIDGGYKKPEEIEKINNSNFISGGTSSSNNETNEKEKGSFFKDIGDFLGKKADEAKKKWNEINFKEKATEGWNKTKKLFNDGKTQVVKSNIYQTMVKNTKKLFQNKKDEVDENPRVEGVNVDINPDQENEKQNEVDLLDFNTNPENPKTPEVIENKQNKEINQNNAQMENFFSKPQEEIPQANIADNIYNDIFNNQNK